MTDVRTVAVIGTGRMGSAMAATLHRAGFDLVLFNRTRAKAEEVGARIGAEVAATPRDAVARADVIVCSLAGDAALGAVYRGSDGIVAGISPGTVILEMSTVDPEVIHDLGREVDAAGGVLLDAPVSGSVQAVEAGSLIIMVGGPEEARMRAEPVLAALASEVFAMGERSAGATVKLAVNALVYGINSALAEALVLAERAGVERSVAYDVFAAGAGGAPFVHYKRAAFEDPGKAPVASSLEIVAKDLDLILRLAGRVDAPMALAETQVDLTRRAIGAGLGGADLSALAVYLRSA